MTKEKIINGCEFQNGCIEYKDISYLKVMPICAIYELSIACHHKEDKCKYYQVYKQLKRLQEENKELKTENEQLNYELENMQGFELLQELKEDLENNKRWLRDSRLHSETYVRERDKYKQALEEIRSYCDEQNLKADYTACYITNRIDEVLNDRN